MKFLVLMFLFFSCAEMQQQYHVDQATWKEANCNPDGAYAMGVEDATNKKKLNSSVFNVCGVKAGASKLEYTKGYKSVNDNPLNILRGTLNDAIEADKRSN